MASSVAAVWNPDLIPLIAQHLPPNVVSCSLRLVNKETSVVCKDVKNVDLSAHVPEHAFACRFSSPDAFRPISMRQRGRLFALTAASGSLANLKLLLRTTARYLTGEDVPADTPEPLLWHAIEFRIHRAEQFHEIMLAAAFAGHGLVCRWLLASGCPVNPARAACAAARGGHLGLMEELRGATGVEVRAVDRVAAVELVAAAAEGCGLADLTRLSQQGLDRELSAWDMARILAAAAASPTADWQAKIAWLEEEWQGRLVRSRMTGVASKVAGSRLADSAERLAWLRDRGYPLADDAVCSAAKAGNISALTYLLDTQGVNSNSSVAGFAVQFHQLDVLKLLHARGCPVNIRHYESEGDLPVAVWLDETFGLRNGSLGCRTLTAVRSCSLPVLRWLHERGRFQAAEQLVQEALSWDFSEELLEWLFEHGCSLQVDKAPDDLAMLRCLERLGWHPCKEVLSMVLERTTRAPLSGPTLRWLRDRGALPRLTGGTLTEWVWEGRSLCSLKWLVGELGGLVDWKAALQAAEGRWQCEKAAWGRGQSTEVVAWIRGRMRVD